MTIKEALTFDDVLLQPAASELVPSEADVSTTLTKNIALGMPILSAAMDTVTEAAMAIIMAQHGGLGVIHKNMSIEEQAGEIRRVKKFESGMVVNPLTISPNAKLSAALAMMEENCISGIPVVEENNKLVGILTNRDVRFVTDTSRPVKELMTAKDLITAPANIDMDDARKLLHQHRIEKLLVVDGDYRCVGLITVKDLEKAQKFPHATKDDRGQLRVAAATGVGKNGIERAEALLAADVDAVVVDTAHGHSKGVLNTVKEVRRLSNDKAIIAGNIATAAGAAALAEAGADVVKVGIGPGSICTTRIVAGVGVPQLTAIMNAAETCRKTGTRIIADGGIKTPGDIAKAIAAGADAVMVGSMLAGTDEAPGDVFLYQGRSYKSYRGMGSIGAMKQGSADRYSQNVDTAVGKLVPEGIEGRVPYKGATSGVLYQLVGGLRSAMGYTGNKDIPSMQKNCEFVKITNAGLKESHVHDVTITREAPNYSNEK